MSLPTETLRQAILSPDPDLRWGAISFFRRSHGDDLSLMPLVIQACERYGLAAFETYYFLADFPQSAESIGWLRRQLDDVDPDAGEAAEKFVHDCLRALSEIDPTQLEPPESIEAICKRFSLDFQESIAQRIELVGVAPDALWRRLTDLCTAADEGDGENSDVSSIFATVEALARHPADCRDKVLEVLAARPESWLEAAAAQLAGRLRLEEAVPYLIELLKDFDGWAYDEANFALADIGTDGVVRQLEQLFVENDDLCLDAANLLGDIHTEMSAATALKLLDQVQDEEVRMALIRSALESYAPEAIEPARQQVIALEKSPESLELRESLLLVCKMLDARIPEYDEWLADSAHDREFRRRWYRETGEPDIEALLEGDEDALLEAESWSDDGIVDEDDEPFDHDATSYAPIVRHDQHVGRNDPCPCGSGKKYKKCCLHKQAIE